MCLDVYPERKVRQSVLIQQYVLVQSKTPAKFELCMKNLMGGVDGKETEREILKM